MAKTILIVLLPIMGMIVLFTGCIDSNEDNIADVKLIISASVNWDDDPEADGIQFIISPIDKDGFLIKDKCVINAKLWSEQDKDSLNKGTLIQVWEGIHVIPKDYTKELGARVSLEYNNYKPLPHENGMLQVEVTISDGRRFTFPETNVRMGYFNWAEVQRQAGCCP